MLNWKNLAALSVVCVFGVTQARAETVLVGPISPAHRDDFSGQGSLLAAQPETKRSEGVVGFDLSYRGVSPIVVSDVNSSPFRNIGLVTPKPTKLSDVDSSVAFRHSVSAFDYSPGLNSPTDVARLTGKSLAVTPIPPAGSEVEPVCLFGIFTQRSKRSSNVELFGGQLSDGDSSTADAVQPTVKSSGAPFFGYTAVSASLMGLVIGVCRRVWPASRGK